jgi:hypothetical protein
MDVPKLIKYTLILFLFTQSAIGMSQENDTLKYIFLGHIKKKINGLDRVDPRIAGLDLTFYDRIWLGGDITDESNLNYETLIYIDSLFDVSNPTNIWAFGNHDQRNYNTDWLREITNKESYYAYFENGITTLVVNYSIPPTDCESLNEQFEMIQQVCDTIQESSHLILVSHNCVWQDVPGLPSPGQYAHANLKYWQSNCIDKPADYMSAIYPMLLQVKDRNIEVINVLGDSGAYSKGKSMVSDQGIYFIASGIAEATQELRGPDKVLIFYHHPESNYLDWQFHNLDSLYQSFQ